MILTVPPVEASISTLERIGMVLRRSTTDWTWDRLRSNVARSMVAFIVPFGPPLGAQAESPESAGCLECNP